MSGQGLSLPSGLWPNALKQTRRITLWLFRGKARWLAVLIPSLLWAFAHLGYVTYPIYARGVELTIMALFLGFIFLKFDLLTTIMAHCTYNMMITGVALLLSSEIYYRISGSIVILILLLPLLPGLYLTIRRRMPKGSPAPESLVISHFEPSDLEQLSAFPVKADWPELNAQPNRVMLCLRAADEILGFATGFVNDGNKGHIDGIYVQTYWRRQYWGATLLDALQEELKNCGATEVRGVVKPEEKPATPRARLWAETYVLRLPGPATIVTEPTPGAQALAFEGEPVPEATTPFRIESLMDGRGLPLASGPFGGTTILVVPATATDEQRAAWKKLEETDAIKKKSKFARLVVLFEEAELPKALQAVKDAGRSVVLVVPAVFCADAGMMAEIRALARPYEEILDLSYLPGLGGGLVPPSPPPSK